MPKLSASQLTTITYQYWDAKNQVIAVAIALAESGGVTTATHKNANGSTDYGLWQINSVHADLLKKYKWSDPYDNARMAYEVFHSAGDSWSPWSTYKSGRYIAFLSVARHAVSGGGSTLPGASGAGTVPTYPGGASSGGNAQPSGLSLPNPLAPIEAIAALVTLLTNPRTWLRLAMFAAGLTLLFMGLKATTTIDNKIIEAGRKAALAAATDGASLAAGKAAKAVSK